MSIPFFSTFLLFFSITNTGKKQNNFMPRGIPANVSVVSVVTHGSMATTTETRTARRPIMTAYPVGESQADSPTQQSLVSDKSVRGSTVSSAPSSSPTVDPVAPVAVSCTPLQKKKTHKSGPERSTPSMPLAVTCKARPIGGFRRTMWTTESEKFQDLRAGIWLKLWLPNTKVTVQQIETVFGIPSATFTRYFRDASLEASRGLCTADNRMYFPASSAAPKAPRTVRKAVDALHILDPIEYEDEATYRRFHIMPSNFPSSASLRAAIRMVPASATYRTRNSSVCALSNQDQQSTREGESSGEPRESGESRDGEAGEAGSRRVTGRGGAGRRARTSKGGRRRRQRRGEEGGGRELAERHENGGAAQTGWERSEPRNENPYEGTVRRRPMPVFIPMTSEHARHRSRPSNVPSITSCQLPFGGKSLKISSHGKRGTVAAEFDEKQWKTVCWYTNLVAKNVADHVRAVTAVRVFQTLVRTPRSQHQELFDMVRRRRRASVEQQRKRQRHRDETGKQETGEPQGEAEMKKKKKKKRKSNAGSSTDADFEPADCARDIGGEAAAGEPALHRGVQDDTASHTASHTATILKGTRKRSRTGSQKPSTLVR